MTPTEMALIAHDGCSGYPENENGICRYCCTRAIEAAIDNERERCARIVLFPVQDLKQRATQEDQSGGNSMFIQLQIHALELAAKKIRETGVV